MTTAVQTTRIEEILQPVESELLARINGVTVHWYGRAATALYRAFQLAKISLGCTGRTEVILPSISCATPANTALLAGVHPRFADVDPRTGMMTLESVQQRCTADTGAVVFIHLFGQTADLKPLSEWCRTKGILLIEDLAQALSASLPDGNPAGSVGDLSVFSFNPTKILECGGGALAVRKQQLVALLAQLSEDDPLPPEVDDARASALRSSYRNLHHSLVSLLRTRAVADVSSAFLELQPAFRQLYLRRMKSAVSLLQAWGELQKVLGHRLLNAEMYQKLLADGTWETLNQWRQSGVCWRYSLLVNFPDELVGFSEAVRRDGFHVSNLYWPVNQFFLPSDECPVAEVFARRIMNLWVDGSVDTEWASRCAASLLKNQPRRRMCS